MRDVIWRRHVLHLVRRCFPPLPSCSLLDWITNCFGRSLLFSVKTGRSLPVLCRQVRIKASMCFYAQHLSAAIKCLVWKERELVEAPVHVARNYLRIHAFAACWMQLSEAWFNSMHASPPLYWSHFFREKNDGIKQIPVIYIPAILAGRNESAAEFKHS